MLFGLMACGGGGSTSTSNPDREPLSTIDESKWRAFVPRFTATNMPFSVTRENAGKTTVEAMDAIDFLRNLVFDDLPLELTFFPLDTVSLADEEQFICDSGSVTRPQTNNVRRIAIFFNNCTIDGATVNGELYAFVGLGSSNDDVTLNFELTLIDPSLDLNAELFGHVQSNGTSEASALLQLSDQQTGEVSLLDFPLLLQKDATGYIRYEILGDLEVRLESRFSPSDAFDLLIIGSDRIEVTGQLQNSAALQVRALDIFDLNFSLLHSPTFDQDSAPTFDIVNPRIEASRLATVQIEINNIFDADIQPVSITAAVTTSVENALVMLDKEINTNFTFEADLTGSYVVNITATDPSGLSTQQSLQIDLVGLPAIPEFSFSSNVDSIIAGTVFASNNELDGPYSIALYGAPSNTEFNAQTGDFSWEISVPQLAGFINTSFSFLFNNGIVNYFASQYVPVSAPVDFAPTPINVALSEQAQFVSTGENITVLQEGIPFLITNLDSSPTFEELTNFKSGLKSGEYIHGLYKDKNEQLFIVVVEFLRNNENSNIRVINSTTGEQVFETATIGPIFQKASIQLIDILGTTIPEIIVTNLNFSTYAIDITSGQTTQLSNQFTQAYCDVNGDGVKEVESFTDIIDPITGLSVFNLGFDAELRVLSRSSNVEQCSFVIENDDFERQMTFYSGIFNRVGSPFIISSLASDNYFVEANIWLQQIDSDAEDEIFISINATNAADNNQVERATYLLNDCASLFSSCTPVQVNDQFISGEAVFNADIDNNGTTEVLMINGRRFSPRLTIQMLSYVGNRLVNLGESQPQVTRELTLQSWENNSLTFTQGLEVDLSGDVSRTINSYERQIKITEQDQVSQYTLEDIGNTYILNKYRNAQLIWELSLERRAQLDDFIIPITEHIYMVGSNQPVFFHSETGEVLHKLDFITDSLYFDTDNSDPIILRSNDVAYILVTKNITAQSYFLKVSVNGDFEQVGSAAASDFTSRSQVTRADFNQDGKLDVGYLVSDDDGQYKYVTTESVEQDDPFLFIKAYFRPLLNFEAIDSCLNLQPDCRFALYKAFGDSSGFVLKDKLTLSEVLGVSSRDTEYKTLGLRADQNNDLEVLIERSGSVFLIKN